MSDQINEDKIKEIENQLAELRLLFATNTERALEPSQPVGQQHQDQWMNNSPSLVINADQLNQHSGLIVAQHHQQHQGSGFLVDQEADKSSVIINGRPYQMQDQAQALEEPTHQQRSPGVNQYIVEISEELLHAQTENGLLKKEVRQLKLKLTERNKMIELGQQYLLQSYEEINNRNMKIKSLEKELRKKDEELTHLTIKMKEIDRKEIQQLKSQLDEIANQHKEEITKLQITINEKDSKLHECDDYEAEIIEINENLHKELKERKQAIERFHKQTMADQKEKNQLKDQLQRQSAILAQFGQLSSMIAEPPAIQPAAPPVIQLAVPPAIQPPAPPVIQLAIQPPAPPVRQRRAPLDQQWCRNCMEPYHLRMADCPARGNHCKRCNNKDHWEGCCLINNPYLRPKFEDD